MKKRILIVGGDPNSVNSELIYKCWKQLPKTTRKKIYIISNYELLKKQFKKLGYPIKLVKINKIKDVSDVNNLKILNIDLKFKNPFKISEKASSKFVMKSLDFAHHLVTKKQANYIINCAINKKLLPKKNIGVTEYLASKCRLPKDKEVMLIHNKDLSVSPLTTHLDIKDVSKKIRKKMIVKKILIINKWFINNMKKKPIIGLLGLNPHNAELRNNSEEVKEIIPALKILKKKNINIEGPLVADTLFISEYKKYDVIVGMFHDQVLNPFKTMFKFNAINITLGLNYLRVSPDHGTAKELIGKKKANPLSLINCVKFLNNF